MAWDYLHASLEALGLLPMMLDFWGALYSNPTAKVLVNGLLFQAFSITNGMRQGSPLSPLLYVLTMKPLLRCLRANPDIKCIQINGREFKTSAFAHYMLLFLSDPLVSLPVLIKDFDFFGSQSNLKMNYSKSHAFNLMFKA